MFKFYPARALTAAHSTVPPLMSVTDSPKQTIFWLVVAALILAIFYLLRSTLTPFIAACILAYALAPAVDRLQGYGVPRVLAAVLVMLAAIFSIFAVLLILIPLLQGEISQLRTQVPILVAAILKQVGPWVERLLGVELDIDPAKIRSWLAGQLSGNTQDVLALLMQHVRSGWNGAVEIIGLIVLVPVLLFYLLADWHRFTANIRELVPQRWAPSVNDALSETDELLGQYLRGQSLLMAALAVWYSLALLVGGVREWLSLGLLTGLLAFIPYVGFGLGLVLALILAMLQLGVAKGLIVIGIVYGIGQLLESYVLTPRLVGDRIGLHPVAVLFALLAFGTLFGFAGMLLALPLAAVVLVLTRRLRQAWLSSSFYTR